jgi:hypothetical protein
MSFGVSSLLAVSTVAHVPANVLWLSRAARSAVRRTGRVLGDTVLDHYTAALGEIAHAGFFAYWSREFRPYLRGAVEQFAPNHISLTERLLKRDWWDKAPPCPSECNSGASFARLAS